MNTTKRPRTIIFRLFIYGFEQNFCRQKRNQHQPGMHQHQFVEILIVKYLQHLYINVDVKISFFVEYRKKYREIFNNLISSLVQFEETSVIQFLIFQTNVGFRIFHRG